MGKWDNRVQAPCKCMVKKLCGAEAMRAKRTNLADEAETIIVQERDADKDAHPYIKLAVRVIYRVYRSNEYMWAFPLAVSRNRTIVMALNTSADRKIKWGSLHLVSSQTKKIIRSVSYVPNTKAWKLP